MARDSHRNPRINYRRTQPSDCDLRFTKTQRFLITSHQRETFKKEAGGITDDVARVDVILVSELVGSHVIPDLQLVVPGKLTKNMKLSCENNKYKLTREQYNNDNICCELGISS